MKTLYININNEQIQSNEELEVLKHDLDSDLFFYLGEKIAKNCKVENENALITDFNTQDNAEDYHKIIAQWNEIKTILFSEMCAGKFEFTLPDAYIHWLRYSEKYNHVYDKNFSHGEPLVIYIDLKELYEESVEDLQRKILRKLERDDLWLEIDEIVFNDDAVARKSSIVRTIKEKYNIIGFKSYKRRIFKENFEQEAIKEQLKEKKERDWHNSEKISELFPITDYNVIIGKTLLSDIPDNNSEIITVKKYIKSKIPINITLDYITFSIDLDSNIIYNCKINNYKRYNRIPTPWLDKFGWSFKLNLGEWVKKLNSKGFIVYEAGHAWDEGDEGTHILAQSPDFKYRIRIFKGHEEFINIDCMPNTTPLSNIYNSLKNNNLKCPKCNGDMTTLIESKGFQYMNCNKCDTIWLKESIYGNCRNCKSSNLIKECLEEEYNNKITCADCGANYIFR